MQRIIRDLQSIYLVPERALHSWADIKASARFPSL